MPLNEALRFEDADPSVKRAFLRTPEKVLLAPHVNLYKWTSAPLIDRMPVSPWWSFVESTPLPSGAVAEGFRVSEERANRLKKPHRDYARVRAAISGEFGNSMKNLLVIQLNEPAWAFAGQASGQPEFAKSRADLSNVLLIGGAHQVWLPNLTPRHLTIVPVRG
jgi:hypothetical protein